jgi:hypothetical protein
MFKKYGFVGILMIIFVQVNFFLQIEPFYSWYFPIVWYGYILVIDAMVYKLRGNSLINNRFSQFLGMIIISMLFWWVFEFINLRVANWRYIGLENIVYRNLFGCISFSTVLPALFETVELIRSLHFFENKKLHIKYKISKRFLHTLIGLGIVCFVLPLFLPKYTFPLIWFSFFFLLDPINYLHKQPSIIGHLKKGNLAIPFSLLLAGIVLGFLWEFWNYQAKVKWIYEIPFISFFKIFEMPILGYLGYFPFSFELYAMYWWVRSLFIHKEHLLAE